MFHLNIPTLKQTVSYHISWFLKRLQIVKNMHLFSYVGAELFFSFALGLIACYFFHVWVNVFLRSLQCHKIFSLDLNSFFRYVLCFSDFRYSRGSQQNIHQRSWVFKAVIFPWYTNEHNRLTLFPLFFSEHMIYNLKNSSINNWVF